MKFINIVFVLILTCNLSAQKTVEDFGYKKFSIQYLGDTVKFILPIKKNEKLKKKPVLFMIQGSRAQPLIGYMSDKRYSSSITLLDFDLWLDSFHVITVSKPGIPLIIHYDKLNKKGEFVDNITNQPPKKYIENNNLEYYTKRNYEVIKYLMKQDWVDTTKIVVAGHSEGSSIALDMADKIEEVTHLIYSSGNPYYSTILDVVQKERKSEKNGKEDKTKLIFEYWKMVVNSPLSLSSEKGEDTYRYMYSFSQNENEKLKRIKKPTLITYGTLEMVIVRL